MRGGMWLALCCSCRIGFDAVDDGFQKPSEHDATLGPDSPPGSGGYTLVDTSAPYQSLADAAAIAGYRPDDDSKNYTVTLPFSFDFYQVSYDTVTVNLNGYVTFTTPLTGLATGENECPFTTKAPDAMIAVFWDDLWASNLITPNATIVTAVAGTAPNRTFTVEWRDMDAFFFQGSSWWSQGLATTQQLVLHEQGKIDLHYGPRQRLADFKDRDCGLDRHRGCSATIGLEGAGGGPVHLVQCGTAAGAAAGFTPIDEGRLLQFTPQ